MYARRSCCGHQRTKRRWDSLSSRRAPAQRGEHRCHNPPRWPTRRCHGGQCIQRADAPCRRAERFPSRVAVEARSSLYAEVAWMAPSSAHEQRGRRWQVAGAWRCAGRGSVGCHIEVGWEPTSCSRAWEEWPAGVRTDWRTFQRPLCWATGRRQTKRGGHSRRRMQAGISFGWATAQGRDWGCWQA